MLSSKKYSNQSLFGHPKGLFVLFCTEMWERFSFYGMRSILVLFLYTEVAEGGFGWSRGSALTLMGLYGMFVYLAGIPGGKIADNYIGKKRAVLLGAVWQCVGHGLLALSSKLTFFLGLLALIIGTGLIKSNISALVGNLYKKGDERKNKGFAIFYQGINIGALLAFIIVPIVAQSMGWHAGFGIAAIGMLISIVTFIGFQHYVPNPTNENLPKDGLKKVILACTLIVSLPLLIYLALHFAGQTSQVGEVIARFSEKYKFSISNGLASIVTFSIIGYLCHVIRSSESKEEKDRIIALSLSFFLVFIFFVGFEQGGGLMVLYTKKYVNRMIGGWEIPAANFQLLNSIFVILFGLLVSILTGKVKKKYKFVNATCQMALGNIIMGFGFLFMLAAVLQVEKSGGKAALYWLVGAYFFLTIGELLLTPVLLSFATNMAPKRSEGLIMGIVFGVIGLSNHFAGQLGSLSEIYSDKGVFQVTFLIPVILGILFLLINKKIIALTHGAEEKQKTK